jgi:uncharacterized protein
MKFAQDSQDEGYFITAYEDDSVTVSGKQFEQSIIVSTDKLTENWGIDSIDSLKQDHIEIILELEPELIVIGTGNRLIFPAVEAYSTIIQRGIGIDFMDTGAACRTYNILMSEGRGVVAGLIL